MRRVVQQCSESVGWFSGDKGSNHVADVFVAETADAGKRGGLRGGNSDDVQETADAKFGIGEQRR